MKKLFLFLIIFTNTNLFTSEKPSLFDRSEDSRQPSCVSSLASLMHMMHRKKDSVSDLNNPQKVFGESEESFQNRKKSLESSVRKMIERREMQQKLLQECFDAELTRCSSEQSLPKSAVLAMGSKFANDLCHSLVIQAAGDNINTGYFGHFLSLPDIHIDQAEEWRKVAAALQDYSKNLSEN